MHQLLYLKHVLIETYWNVKNGVLSISRLPVNVLIETYWNVKLKNGGTHIMKSSVLIETYWNVKSIVTLILAVFSCRINRNILECKGGSFPHADMTFAY